MGTKAENASVGDSFGRDGELCPIYCWIFSEAIDGEFRAEFIKLPDAAACQVDMTEFLDKRVPGCIGAMDGKHWKTCMGHDDELASRTSTIIYL